MKRGLLLLALLLASCLNQKQTLPRSTGLFSEVVFVVEDILWETSIKQLVEKTFSENIKGVNQKEPAYTIIQINFSEFKSVLKTHRNIIIISKDIEEKTEKNRWAESQLSACLKWTNNKEIMLNQLIKLKSIFDINEVSHLRRQAKKSSNKILEKKIKEKFLVEIIVPKEYTEIEENPSFFWATYNPEKEEEIKHIFVFSFTPSQDNLKKEVLEKIDSLWSKHLFGSSKDSYVQIEERYPLEIKDNTFRGLWKLKNGFMGGPFIIKIQKINKKIVVTAGLVFAPNSKKRSYVKTLEAIL